MRKGLIIILAVAIIGGLGVYQKAHKTTNNTAIHGASSTAQAVPASSASSTQNTNSSTTGSAYKDGTYTGKSENTEFGTVQVQAVVSGGKITDINFLQMPSDLGHSQEVTAFSEPLLKQQTVKNQTANIDFISGATTTSEAYESSLQAALNQAV